MPNTAQARTSSRTGATTPGSADSRSTRRLRAVGVTGQTLHSEAASGNACNVVPGLPERDGAAAMRAMAIVAMLVIGSGCGFLSKCRQVDRTVKRVAGATGWYRVNPLLGLDLKGNVTIPPRDPPRDPEAEETEEDEEYDETVPLVERIQLRFARQLSPVFVTPETACGYLFDQEGGTRRPVYVLIHGVRGPGPEWWPVVPTLSARRPDGMFLFRWNVTQSRSEIIDALVAGVNRINACHPGGVVVLAHSAGGVVVSFAVSRLAVATEVAVYTVASPLAGAGVHRRVEEVEGANRFLRDLGATKKGFPAAAPNVTVTHLRTQYPGDLVMEPVFEGHAPNMRGVGVLGATEIDLPSQLSHDGSLLYVVRRLAKLKSDSVLDRAP